MERMWRWRIFFWRTCLSSFLLQRASCLVSCLIWFFSHNFAWSMQGTSWLFILLLAWLLLTVNLSDAIIDKLLILFETQLFIIRNGRHNSSLAINFLPGLMKLCQVWMSQSLWQTNPFLRIEMKHSNQKVQSIIRNIAFEPLSDGF